MLRFILRQPDSTLYTHKVVSSALLRRIRLFGIAFFLLTLLYFSLSSAPGNLQQIAYGQSAPSAQGRLAVVGAQGADLYDVPDGAVLESLTPGATLTAVGRTADSLWVVVQTDDERSGWVETQSIVIFGTSQLPVMLETPAQSPTATPGAVTASATSTTTVATTVPPTPTVAPPTATPTLSPTPVPPTPSPTPIPPTPTPQPTATATAILGVQSDLIAVVGSTGATLRTTPGGETLRTLSTGTALSANGRTADGSALFVEITDGTTGWVDVKGVVVFNVKSLPVREEVADAAEGEMTEPVTESVTQTMAMTVTASVTVTEPMTEPATEAVVANPVTTTTNTSRSTQALRPTPAADGRPTAQVAMTGSRLNIRSGPGTTFAIVAKALPREIFVALGRNSDSTWVQLEVTDIAGGLGWVAATYVTLSDPIANLPVTAEVNETAAPASSPLPQPQPTVTTTGNDTTPGTTIPPVATPTVAAAPAAQRTGPTGLSGKLVIQSSWGGKFYLYNLATGELRALSGGLDPAISPDGSQIAFTRIGNENGVYLINVDGSNERKIFGERDGLMSPKWSPDGKWIVFSRNDGFYKCRNLGFGICLSDAQIIDQFNLPAVEGIVDQIFSDSDRESRPDWMIARIAANGEEYRDLAALNSARAPDWNEAGIVYQSTGGIQITKDEGDADTKKVYFDGYDWDPDWQPNGGRIVFQSKEGPHWEIFGVNPDGSGLASLTRPVTTLVDQLPSNVSPVWSPDGNSIAYLSNRDENNNAGAWRVWVMNADGSNQRPLPITLEINYSYNSEQMISWGR